MKKVTFIGGDVRSRIAAVKLKESGFSVETLGLYKGEKGIIEDSDALIFPVPTTRDKKTVFAPFSDEEISLEKLEQRFSKEQLLLTCNYSFQNHTCIDYGKSDGFALLNAVPTAEAAISIAIENTDFTLWQSNVLVIGFGRVGKILANRLASLGANVTVTARKSSDFGLAEALNYNFIHTKDIARHLGKYSVIFNTLDFTVIDEAGMKKCSAPLLIDLSSKGGFDPKLAEQEGKKAIVAPGLPGKTAPVTAGNILAKTLTDILHENLLD